MSKLGDRAIVCGAGMGGLLAARVLSEFYETVTVVERDKLSDDASPRRGIRQGRHSHVLWSRGLQELARLFPGLLDETRRHRRDGLR
jgi:2-polyprenyl-6-methoxyphenol hydroxylase-like FAD-dependent oxidoreductase